MTPREQGEQAARKWIKDGKSGNQPKNPFSRPQTHNEWKQYTPYQAWSCGFDFVIYQEYGDTDSDAIKAEKAFGC